MRFHDFWGTCENQPMFTEDSEDKPNYTPVSRSIYFLVFCALPSSFQNLAHIQPRTAPHWISPPVRACTFLQLWVLGVCQRRRICSCARATPLPAPGACCLTWILLLHSVISGKKYGSENWEFMRWYREMGKGKVVTLHRSLGCRKRRVNMQRRRWKTARIWAVLALTCWDLRLGTKV